MEKLKGVDALSVVYKRFSDGCEVIQCILEFYREMAEVEHSYASRLLKLMESSSYTFHSNILMQWLGSGPFEERGTVKRSWQKMGTELTKLAGLHAEKAENFTDTVRKPLQELLPQLEEERRVLKQRKQEMETQLKNVEKRFQKAKKNYFLTGDYYAQLKSEFEKTPDQAPGFAPLRFTRSANQLEKKLSDVEKEFKENEDIYTQTHRELLELQQSLNEEVVNLLTDVHAQELKRVNTIAKSLQEFAKTLSNTAPGYLEGMQRIVLSVDEVDGTSDIESFVSEHPDLQCPPIIPQLELHSCSSRSPDIDHKTDKCIIREKDQPREDTGQYQIPSATEQPKLDPSLNDSVHPVRPGSVKVDPTHSAVETTSPATPKSKPPVLSKPVHIKQQTPKENLSTRQESRTKQTNKESSSITRERSDSHSKDRSDSTRERSDSQRTPQQQIYHRLTRQSQLNDYYGLLGVQPTANQEELARARREVTSRLHPDHFTGNPGQQTKAQEKLVLINQAFTDVLRQPANKQLYDQLCRYREKYHRILDQESRSLELAKTKLSALHSSMRRARFPLALLEEVQLAIELIEKRTQEQNQ